MSTRVRRIVTNGWPVARAEQSPLGLRRRAVIGSANFDNRSMMLNDEIALVVDDADLVVTVTASFEADLARARRIDRLEGGLASVQRILGRALLITRAML